jgi:hypothetical protein
MKEVIKTDFIDACKRIHDQEEPLPIKQFLLYMAGVTIAIALGLGVAHLYSLHLTQILGG